MIISKEVLEERTKNQDVKWLNLTATQNRLKMFIKENKNKLSSDMIEFVWSSYNYRPQLAKFQKLTPGIIADALQRQDAKGYISTATYINLIAYQSLTDAQVLAVSEIGRKHYEDVWKAIPQRVFSARNNDIEFIVKLIHQSNSGFYEDIVNGVIKLLETRDLSIIELMEKLFESGKFYERFLDNLLLAVSKKFLIADNIIDEIIFMIEEHTQDALLVGKFSEYLIARDNCSINMKAKLLLKNI